MNMQGSNKAKEYLKKFGELFLFGDSRVEWLGRVKKNDLTNLSVFPLWERHSRNNDLCVFWRKDNNALISALTELGLNGGKCLVIGTGHNVGFGIKELSFEGVFSGGFSLLEGLIFFGVDIVIVDDHDGQTCVCCSDKKVAEALRKVAR